MARLRYANQLGALGGSLTSGGTTITFAVAPSFATITGSDYIPLVLDPATGTSSSSTFEVVYLTAYTSGATTGTISRGQEGTTAQAHSNGAFWTCAPTPLDAMQPPNLQQGVVGSGDLAASSISLNTSTGAITLTIANAEPCWVSDANSVLVPVYHLSAATTQTPGSLPASTKYAIYGIEIDTNNNLSIVKGTDSATQLNTGSLIASNTPATSSGKMRIADFALWNNAGTINFSDHTTVATKGTNWIDRRPWARGAFWRTVRNANAAAGNDYSVTSQTSIANIDGTNLIARIECTGNPMRITLTGSLLNTVLNAYTRLYPLVDNAGVDGATSLGGQWIFRQTASDEVIITPSYVYAPAAGSHLFSWAWVNDNLSTTTMYARATLPVTMTVEEILRPSANNGTS